LGAGSDSGSAAAIAAAATTIPAVSPIAAAASSSSATVTSSATAPAAAAAERPFLTGTRFIDGQCAAFIFLPIQFAGGRLGGFLGFHGDESEATGPSAHAIQHQADLGYRTVLGEKILKIILSDIVGKVSHEQFCTHMDYSICDWRVTVGPENPNRRKT
jgi:hypothetical protein